MPRILIKSGRVHTDTLSRDDTQHHRAALSLPRAHFRQESNPGIRFKNDHDGEVCVRCHIVALVLDEPGRVRLCEPVDSTDLAEVHRLVGPDGEVGVDLQHARHLGSSKGGGRCVLSRLIPSALAAVFPESLQYVIRACSSVKCVASGR